MKNFKENDNEDIEQIQTKEKSKYYTIFKQRLAGYLLYHGLRLLDKQPNFKNEQYDVFYFDAEKIDVIENLIEKYKLEELNKDFTE